LERADSNEFDTNTPDPVVIFMPEVCIYCNLIDLYLQFYHKYVSFVCTTLPSETLLICIYSFIINMFPLFVLHYHLKLNAGFKDTYGKHNETRITKDAIPDP
jgi:hypothetical protein